MDAAATERFLICARRQLLRLRRVLGCWLTWLRRADKRIQAILVLVTLCSFTYCLPDSRFPRYHYVPPRRWSNRPDRICGTRQYNYSDYFQLPISERSLNNEDLDLFHKLFLHATYSNGTYVELGAFNGKHESNTRFFDVCLGSSLCM